MHNIFLLFVAWLLYCCTTQFIVSLPFVCDLVGTDLTPWMILFNIIIGNIAFIYFVGKNDLYKR